MIIFMCTFLILYGAYGYAAQPSIFKNRGLPPQDIIGASVPEQPYFPSFSDEEKQLFALKEDTSRYDLQRTWYTFLKTAEGTCYVLTGPTYEIMQQYRYADVANLLQNAKDKLRQNRVISNYDKFHIYTTKEIDRNYVPPVCTNINKIYNELNRNVTGKRLFYVLSVINCCYMNGIRNQCPVLCAQVGYFDDKVLPDKLEKTTPFEGGYSNAKKIVSEAIYYKGRSLDDSYLVIQPASKSPVYENGSLCFNRYGKILFLNQQLTGIGVFRKDTSCERPSDELKMYLIHNDIKSELLCTLNTTCIEYALLNELFISYYSIYLHKSNNDSKKHYQDKSMFTFFFSIEDVIFKKKKTHCHIDSLIKCTALMKNKEDGQDLHKKSLYFKVTSLLSSEKPPLSFYWVFHPDHAILERTIQHDFSQKKGFSPLFENFSKMRTASNELVQEAVTIVSDNSIQYIPFDDAIKQQTLKGTVVEKMLTSTLGEALSQIPQDEEIEDEQANDDTMLSTVQFDHLRSAQLKNVLEYMVKKYEIIEKNYQNLTHFLNELASSNMGKQVDEARQLMQKIQKEKNECKEFESKYNQLKLLIDNFEKIKNNIAIVAKECRKVEGEHDRCAEAIRESFAQMESLKSFIDAYEKQLKEFESATNLITSQSKESIKGDVLKQKAEIKEIVQEAIKEINKINLEIKTSYEKMIDECSQIILNTKTITTELSNENKKLWHVLYGVGGVMTILLVGSVAYLQYQILKIRAHAQNALT